MTPLLVLLLQLLTVAAPDAASRAGMRATIPPVRAEPAPQALARTWMFERTETERWLHARQRAEFTEPERQRDWMHAVITTPATSPARDGRSVSVDIPWAYSTRFELDAAGRVRAPRTSLTRLPTVRLLIRTAADSERAELALRADTLPADSIALPELRLFELVPVFAPPRLAVGAAWRDTFHLVAGRGDNRSTLRGVRVSVITGDTVLDGRRLYIVKDSARVHLDERAGSDERTLASRAITTRTADGTVRGRYFYDVDIALARQQFDTVQLRGSATLAYADGRRFQTAARYEQTRALALFDSAGYLESERARRATERPSGMLIVPTTDVEERLRRGDARVQDSLFAALARTHDATERGNLLRLFGRWGWNDAFRERVKRFVLASGDTARALNALQDAGWGAQLDVAQARFLLPFLRNPGLLFDFGMARDQFYENIGGGILLHPPAVVPDSTRWPCTRAACTLLANELRTAREPRLRQLAIAAHFGLEPRRWLDSLQANAGSMRFSASAQDLLRGIGATWPASSHMPLPADARSWRAWYEWLNGVKPEAAQPRPGPRPNDVMTQFRFEDTHRYGLRMQELLTGRDVARELQAAYAAGNDTARFVFGATLLAVDKLHISMDSIARQLQGSASKFDRELALRALPRSFRQGTRAPEPVTTQLTDSLLAMLTTGAPSWPALPGHEPFWAFHKVVSDTTPIYVNVERISDASRARWSRTTRVVTTPEFTPTRAQYPAMVIHVTPLDVDGDVAHFSATWSYVSTSGWAGGADIYLLNTARGWLIVLLDEWIT